MASGAAARGRRAPWAGAVLGGGLAVVAGVAALSAGRDGEGAGAARPAAPGAGAAQRALLAAAEVERQAAALEPLVERIGRTFTSYRARGGFGLPSEAAALSARSRAARGVEWLPTIPARARGLYEEHRGMEWGAAVAGGAPLRILDPIPPVPEALRGRGFAEGPRFAPARPEHHPLTAAVGITVDDGAYGMDLGALPEVAKAVAGARGTRAAALTGPSRLVERASDGGSVLRLLLPVEAPLRESGPGAPQQGDPEANGAGFVALLVDAGRLLESAREAARSAEDAEAAGAGASGGGGAASVSGGGRTFLRIALRDLEDVDAPPLCETGGVVLAVPSAPVAIVERTVAFTVGGRRLGAVARTLDDVAPGEAGGGAPLRWLALAAIAGGVLVAAWGALAARGGGGGAGGGGAAGAEPARAAPPPSPDRLERAAALARGAESPPDHAPAVPLSPAKAMRIAPPSPDPGAPSSPSGGSRSLFDSDSGRRLARLTVEQRLEHYRDALARSEDRARAIFGAVPDAMYRLTRDGLAVDCKAHGFKGLSTPSASLTARRLTEIFPDEVCPDVMARVEKVLAGRGLEVLRFSAPSMIASKGDGPRHFEARLVPHGGGEVLAIVRDVTQQADLERMKQEFLATVSHELKTPLTAIRGAIEFLATAQAPPPETAAELIGIARVNADRMIALLNDLLDLERMQAGRLAFDVRDVAPEEVVDPVVTGLRSLARAAGVGIAVEVRTGGAAVRGDARRLAQVLTNLVTNAIRYAPSGTDVNVRVLPGAPGRARFEVIDRGPGVPPEEQARLFSRFVQLAPAPRAPHAGSGLGLAVSKGIIEAHRGEIGITSTAGGGATFWFEVLLAAAPASGAKASAAPESARDQGLRAGAPVGASPARDGATPSQIETGGPSQIAETPLDATRPGAPRRG